MATCHMCKREMRQVRSLIVEVEGRTVEVTRRDNLTLKGQPPMVCIDCVRKSITLIGDQDIGEVPVQMRFV